MTERSPGRVITFYSYKGGTGRSMALANVAWILASQGKRVLVVDWDLEAPGLHRYFAPFLADHELATSDGVIDFLGAYSDAVLTPPRNDEDRRPDWYLAYADISRLAISLDWKFDGGGSLDFIGAGRQGPAYASRVANFPWQAFFDRLGGGTLLDAARDRMQQTYDYVLLDSRTGVSDAAGICTIQMPDTLVVCFTLNNQSIAGAAGIARRISAKPEKADMPIFPVAMRIEEAEHDKLEIRRKYARSSFALFPAQLDTVKRDEYWGGMEVHYKPYYAYEELLAVFGDAHGRDSTMLAAMERLTGYVSNGEVTKVALIPERLRLLYRDMYAWQSDRATGRRESIREAERVLAAFGSTDQQTSRRLLTRLVRVGRSEEGGADARARVPKADLVGSEAVLRAFATAGVITVESDPALKEEFAELADDGLLQRWPTLRQWIEEDREALLWRQQLRIYCAEWERSGRDPGVLLSGRPLAEADANFHKASEQLNDRERAFIEASRAEEEKRNEKENERDRLRAELAESQGKLDEVHAIYRVRRSRAVAVAVVVLLLVGVGFWLRPKSLADTPERSPTQAGVLAALITSAGAAASSGDDSTALARYDSSIALDSTFMAAYLARGNYYASRSAYELAVSDFGRAIALDSTADEAYLRRGMALRRLGNSNLALKDLDRTIARQPANAQALVERGMVYESTSRPTDALQDYGSAIRADSGLMLAYVRRGTLFSEQRNFPGARADLLRALELSSEGDSLYTVALARLSALPALNASTVGNNPVQAGNPTVMAIQRVALQYDDSLDAKDVFDIYLTLKRRRGWRVDAPERAVAGGKNPSASYHGVRFYYPADRAFAGQVRDLVGAELTRRGWADTFPLYKMREGVFKTSPGLAEVWIASSNRLSKTKKN